MLQRSLFCLKSQHHNVLRRGRPHMHKYRELNRWQRQAQGISKWDQSHSHRPLPYVERFNPEGVGVTRGTSSFAWRWWHTQYPWLPNVSPENHCTASSAGYCPKGWDEEFTAVVRSMQDDEVREYLLTKLTEVIFAETQRDGYELRRLDFEGKPLTELPEPRIIESFVFAEDTLRERVVRQVVEGVFRLSPTSTDRAELRSVANIIDYVLTHVTAARPANDNSSNSNNNNNDDNKGGEGSDTSGVTAATRRVLRKFPMQPELGFAHALPTDTRDRVLQEWERMHHLDWQFGNAVYNPRNTESTQGNLTWLREERHFAARKEFMKDVESGAAKARHLQLIAEAAISAKAQSAL